ncbi:leucine rich repeatcontaining protein BspA family protein [Entamoeba histolytica KU27]|uniref:Leucine rich repeatcontaining protein BspA family protein n=1 Tax=Entamoeba histolytica KU27 TaxID=885311 RepID=M2QHC9_ENTHI|nr:leucine rich repeatcontaining protein BspA family protein [Entamoeba histolytica KU27]
MSQLDNDSIYHLVKYLNNEKEAFMVKGINKKYNDIYNKFEYNPFSVSSTDLFPRMKKQCLYNKKDKQLEGMDQYIYCYVVGYKVVSQSKENNVIFKKVRLGKHDHDKMPINYIPPGIQELGKSCYYYAANTEINLPTTITKIGYDCFYYNLFKSIDLSHVLQIDVGAFNICNELSAVTLSGYLKNIPSYCFESCKSLLEMDLRYIEQIGDCAFNECTSLSSITISTNLKDVSYSAFKKCFSLQHIDGCGMKVFHPSISSLFFDVLQKNGICCDGEIHYIREDKNYFNSLIPLGVNIIEQSVFLNDCITSVSIPSSVHMLSEHSFDSCRHLKEVILPNNLTSLPTCCFNKCFALEKINLENLISIGRNCFNCCKQLKEIHLDSATDLKHGCFDRCDQLSKVILNSCIERFPKECFSGSRGLKEITMNNIKVIEDSSFMGCSELETIDISQCISIGKCCFMNCTKLTSIQFNSQLIQLEESIFENCGFIQISLPSTLRSLNNNVFKNCTSLKSIDIQMVTQLGNNCFENCSSLSNVKLSNELKILSVQCFKNCSQLRDIQLPSSLEVLQDDCFDKCTSLTNITIPSHLKVLSRNVGLDKGLVELKLFSSLKTIQKGCCLSWKQLKKVIGLKVLEKIEQSAFENCEELESIEFNPTLQFIGRRAFYNCKKITHVYIPNNTIVEEEAFMNCSGIQEIIIGEHCHIPRNCFRNCGTIKEVIIHDWVDFDEKAFVHCTIQSIKSPCNVLNGKIPYWMSVIASKNNIECSVIEYTRYDRMCYGSNIPIQCSQLGNRVFNSCNNSLIILPTMITKIGAQCFNHCKKLKEIRFNKILEDKIDAPSTITKVPF